MDQNTITAPAEQLPVAPQPRRWANHRIGCGDVEKFRKAIEFARDTGQEVQFAKAFIGLLSLVSTFAADADKQGRDLYASIEDDGCPYSWRWWAGCIKEGEDPNRMSRTAGTFFMNGGLIYHGPGAGETFAVTLGDTARQPWQIHT